MAGTSRTLAGRHWNPVATRTVRRAALAVGSVVVVWTLVVVGAALAVPGNDSFVARLAESARDHGLGVVVTALEEARYRLGGPAVGGSLTSAQARALARDERPPSTRSGTP